MYYGFPSSVDILLLGQAGGPQRAAPPDDCLHSLVTHFPSNRSEMLSSLNTAPNQPFTRSFCRTNMLWEQAQTCNVPIHLESISNASNFEEKKYHNLRPQRWSNLGFQTCLLLLSTGHVERWHGNSISELKLSSILEKLVLRIKY